SCAARVSGQGLAIELRHEEAHHHGQGRAWVWARVLCQGYDDAAGGLGKQSHSGEGEGQRAVGRDVPYGVSPRVLARRAAGLEDEAVELLRVGGDSREAEGVDGDRGDVVGRP